MPDASGPWRRRLIGAESRERRVPPRHPALGQDGGRPRLFLMTFFAVRLVVHGEDHLVGRLGLAVVAGAALGALLHGIHGELARLPLLHLEDLGVAGRALLVGLLVLAVAERHLARAVLALVEAEVCGDLRLRQDGPDARQDHHERGDQQPDSGTRELHRCLLLPGVAACRYDRCDLAAHSSDLRVHLVGPTGWPGTGTGRMKTTRGRPPPGT